MEGGPCLEFFCVRLREKLQPSVLLDTSFMYSAVAAAAAVIQVLFSPQSLSRRNCSSWNLPLTLSLHVEHEGRKPAPEKLRGR